MVLCADVDIVGADAAALVVGRRRRTILRRRRRGVLLLQLLLRRLLSSNVFLERVRAARRLTAGRGVAAHACAHVRECKE